MATNISPAHLDAVTQFVKELNEYMWATSGASTLDGGFAKVAVVAVDDNDMHLSFETGHEWQPDPGPEQDAEREVLSYSGKVPCSLVDRKDMTLNQKLEFVRGQWQQTGYFIKKWQLRLLKNGVQQSSTTTENVTYEWPDTEKADHRNRV